METKYKPFTADQFIPTEYQTAEQKAKFANHFVRFVESNYPEGKFPKWFYVQLSMCFGHIAEYNKVGFYEKWFSTAQKRERFLNHCIVFPCYGQPEFTYCDVEKALIAWIKERIMLF